LRGFKKFHLIQPDWAARPWPVYISVKQGERFSLTPIRQYTHNTVDRVNVFEINSKYIKTGLVFLPPAEKIVFKSPRSRDTKNVYIK
jgi:hypothetical protein